MTEPLALLRALGESPYGGEPVTQREHALQCAALAHAAGADDALVLAALLHDVGHLLDLRFFSADGPTEDLRHEEVGAALLAERYGPAVAEPVRLHVAAKRHLAGNPGWLSRLSDASRHSLALQGGPFTEAERAAFLALPGAADAVRLRRWDDAAKVPGAEVPDLERWASLERRLRRPPG